MDSEKYLQDLKEIKNLMHKSSRFLSLSGLSGIMAGIYALLGATIAFYLLQNKKIYLRTFASDKIELIVYLLAIALIVAFLAVITAMYLTIKKANKQQVKIWDATTQTLLVHFLIPLITGAILGLILMHHEHYGMIAPISLIFYGLALINASKFTLDTVKYLGISEVIVGLFAAYFVGFGLYFWALGFGVLHIVYGGIMYIKEQKD